MAERTIRCSLISPERPLYEGNAQHVVFTTKEGEMGVYPAHAAFIAALGTGEVRIVEAAGVKRFAVRGGFVQVIDDQVNLLVDIVRAAEEIDAAKLEQEAQALQATKPHTDEEFSKKFLEMDWLSARKRIMQKSK